MAVHAHADRHAMRPADVGDVPAIARLHAENWRRYYRALMTDAYLDERVSDERRAVWAKKLENPSEGPCVFLLEHDERLMGFVSVCPHHDNTWGHFIDALHVDAALVGQGHGRGLLKQGLAWLNTRHADAPVYLWVMHSHHRAERFYRGLGGSVAEERLRRFPCGTELVNFRYVWPSSIGLMAECG